MDSSITLQVVGLFFDLIGVLLVGLGLVGQSHQDRVERWIRAFLWQPSPKQTILTLATYLGALFGTLTLMAVVNLGIAIWVALVLSAANQLWLAIVATFAAPLLLILIMRDASRGWAKTPLRWTWKITVLLTAGPYLLLFGIISIPVGFVWWLGLKRLRLPLETFREQLEIERLTPLFGLGFITIGFGLQILGVTNQG